MLSVCMVLYPKGSRAAVFRRAGTFEWLSEKSLGQLGNASEEDRGTTAPPPDSWVRTMRIPHSFLEQG